MAGQARWPAQAMANAELALTVGQFVVTGPEISICERAGTSSPSAVRERSVELVEGCGSDRLSAWRDGSGP